MQTTVCAYCDHEVKITPDGVCLFCGGNLAEETIDEERDNRMARIRQFIIGEPFPRKSRRELYAPFRTESNLEEIQRMLEREKLAKTKKEKQELDRIRRTTLKSETIEHLQKALTQSIFPRWFKFMAFLIGVSLSLFYTLPFLQEPIIRMFSLVNSSPLSIMFISIIPIMFMLIILKKFERF